jgi:hypothetical protein
VSWPPEQGPAEFDRELARQVICAAGLAAAMEATRPGLASQVRNPDGSAQGETRAERDGRITSAAVLYLLETGLLVIAPDAGRRLGGPLPLGRVTS